MRPGCEGTDPLMVILTDLGTPVPQLLLAETESVPPDDPVVTVIELEEELPDQPAGNVHV